MEDDYVGLFVEFVKTVYGADTLDENLQFIADALVGKDQLRNMILNYFLNSFYKDYCKMYQKWPIYWLFDSGKKNGFKCLIYMHRYQPDTIARIRTDYVHEQQAYYRTAIADREQRIANAATGERVKLKKELTALQAQDAEIRTYEEKIHHLADQMISVDLDDGVKKNYAIFKDVLAKIKWGEGEQYEWWNQYDDFYPHRWWWLCPFTMRALWYIKLCYWGCTWTCHENGDECRQWHDL